ncbi:transcription initiation factor TFIID subunit 7 [Tritrichomonas musculus]|uniref:Transcription initiation factor TFIID subunit 7 n=1 Tax=Tritrichomonas musculus TaxID=1915356 RepID=A0ABR2JEW9_9EUKA
MIYKKSTNPGGEDEPYYHPILEEQMIIRFPADIAARLNQSMDDEEEGFKDFNICFTDKKHANVKLFGEELKAVLLSLPTIVETHRTVDGSHLFKSADIGEILIVHRPNAPPDGFSEDFVFDNGLTPPTLNIVKKRLAKQEAARANQSESSSIEGIQYWEMVEIQLAALLSKEKTAKPVCRQEFLDEPDVDPVILEKILRRNGKSEFKGYSGTVIDDSEIEDFTNGDDPVVHIPEEIVEEVIPTNTEEEKTAESGEAVVKSGEAETNPSQTEETDDTFESTAAGSSASEETSAATSSASSDNESNSDEEEEEEEEEEEQDLISRQIDNYKKKFEKLEVNYNILLKNQKALIEQGNQVMIDKINEKVNSVKKIMDETTASIDALIAKQAQNRK